jgi:hypothetical protein
MTLAGFEPPNPASQQRQTHALGHAATEIGLCRSLCKKSLRFYTATVFRLSVRACVSGLSVCLLTGKRQIQADKEIVMVEVKGYS